MTCRICHGTGQQVELQDRDHTGPIARFTRVAGFCDCQFGKFRRDREIESNKASEMRAIAARDWASANMIPRVWNASRGDWEIVAI